jgi:hypothetical protein
MPRPPTNAIIDHLLDLHDRWSDELWRRFDKQPFSFERWISETIPRGVAA